MILLSRMISLLFFVTLLHFPLLLLFFINLSDGVLLIQVRLDSTKCLSVVSGTWPRWVVQKIQILLTYLWISIFIQWIQQWHPSSLYNNELLPAYSLYINIQLREIPYAFIGGIACSLLGSTRPKTLWQPHNLHFITNSLTTLHSALLRLLDSAAASHDLVNLAKMEPGIDIDTCKCPLPWWVLEFVWHTTQTSSLLLPRGTSSQFATLSLLTGWIF